MVTYPPFLNARNKLNLVRKAFFIFWINIMSTSHEDIFCKHKTRSEYKPRNCYAIFIFPNRANDSNRLECYVFVYYFIVFLILITYGLEFSKIMATVFRLIIPFLPSRIFPMHWIKLMLIFRKYVNSTENNLDQK